MGHNGIAYRIGTANSNPVYWKPNECHNPHLILAGATGSGKTYTIREILSAFMAQGINFTVIDKHGDMDSLGDIAEYRFGYGFNRGINPLTVHPDIEYGGPEASATAFGSLLNDLSGVHRLGPEQQSMLHHAIMDLYYANKIYQDKPESWQKPSFPDLRDLERFLVFKYKKLLIGGDKESKEETDCLQSLYKDKRALEKLEKAKAQGAEVDAKIDDKIASR